LIKICEIFIFYILLILLQCVAFNLMRNKRKVQWNIARLLLITIKSHSTVWNIRHPFIFILGSWSRSVNLIISSSLIQHQWDNCILKDIMYHMMPYTTDRRIEITPLRNPLPHNSTIKKNMLKLRSSKDLKRHWSQHPAFIEDIGVWPMRGPLSRRPRPRENRLDAVMLRSTSSTRSRFRFRAGRANSSHPKTLSGASQRLRKPSARRV